MKSTSYGAACQAPLSEATQERIMELALQFTA